MNSIINTRLATEPRFLTSCKISLLGPLNKIVQALGFLHSVMKQKYLRRKNHESEGKISREQMLLSREDQQHTRPQSS